MFACLLNKYSFARQNMRNTRFGAVSSIRKLVGMQMDKLWRKHTGIRSLLDVDGQLSLLSKPYIRLEFL